MFTAARGVFLLTRTFAGAARSSIALQVALGAMQGSKLSGLGALTTGLPRHGACHSRHIRAGGRARRHSHGGRCGHLADLGACCWCRSRGPCRLNYWEPIKNWVGGFASAFSSAIGELTGGLGKAHAKLWKMRGRSFSISPTGLASIRSRGISGCPHRRYPQPDRGHGQSHSRPGWRLDLRHLHHERLFGRGREGVSQCGRARGQGDGGCIINAFGALIEWFRGWDKEYWTPSGRLTGPIVPGWAAGLLGGGAPPAPAAPGNDNAPAPAAAPGKQAAIAPIQPASTQHAAVDVRIAVDGQARSRARPSSAGNVKVARPIPAALSGGRDAR